MICNSRSASSLDPNFRGNLQARPIAGGATARVETANCTFVSHQQDGPEALGELAEKHLDALNSYFSKQTGIPSRSNTPDVSVDVGGAQVARGEVKSRGEMDNPDGIQIGAMLMGRCLPAVHDPILLQSNNCSFKILKVGLGLNHREFGPFPAALLGNLYVSQSFRLPWGPMGTRAGGAKSCAARRSSETVPLRPRLAAAALDASAAWTQVGGGSSVRSRGRPGGALHGLRSNRGKAASNRGQRLHVTLGLHEKKSKEDPSGTPPSVPTGRRELCPILELLISRKVSCCSFRLDQPCSRHHDTRQFPRACFCDHHHHHQQQQQQHQQSIPTDSVILQQH